MTPIEKLHEQFREECSNELPVRLEGWCTPEKAIILSDLIIERRPGLVVESGIFGGRSLICMALTLRQLGSGVAVGIDPWTVEAALEGGLNKEEAAWWTQNVKLEKIYEDFVRAVVRLNLTKECRWVRGKSVDASKLFGDSSINLFHQDSNHTETVSCIEVNTWYRKIAPGGLWIMDDSNWASQQKALRMIEERGFAKLATHTIGDQQFMVFEKK